MIASLQKFKRRTRLDGFQICRQSGLTGNIQGTDRGISRKYRTSGIWNERFPTYFFRTGTINGSLRVRSRTRLAEQSGAGRKCKRE
jgi:hypothetical protein